MSQPKGIAELTARVEGLERSIKVLDAGTEHYEQLGPDLRAFLDATLPKRLASLERATAALMQPDDPTSRIAFDLRGMMLARRPGLTADAVGKASRAVHDALAQLRSALRTYSGCVELAAGEAAKDAATMREHGALARRRLEEAKAARSKAARSIALELEVIDEQRRALAVARSGETEAAE